MKRLPTWERVLLAVLVPLWALCFAACIVAAVQRTGYPPLNITHPAGDSYPQLIDFKSGLGGEESGLHPGDRIVAVGGRDLRGHGQIELAVILAGARGGELLPVTYERDGSRAATSLRAASYAAYWPRLPASLVFALTAVLLLLRASPSALIRTVFGAYMAWALLLACTFAGGAAVTVFSIALQGVALAFGVSLGVRAGLLFPQGEAEGRWARHGPWLFLLLGPLDVSRFYGVPFPRAIGVHGETVLGLLSTAVLCVAVMRNYRRATAIQRRQIKWVLFGAYAAVVPPAAIAVLAAVEPRFEPLLVVSVSSLALVPVSLWIAIARYNLFDIDRLISGAASSSLLGVVLMVGFLAAVPRLAYSLGAPLGIEPETARLTLSLLLAAAIVPLQRLLRPRLDQILFSERHAVEQGFQSLLEDLSAAARPQDLAELAGLRLYALLAPESLILYTRGTRAYEPALVLGRTAPSAFDSEGPLIAVLRAQGGPVTSEHLPRARRGGELNPFDRAAVGALGVPVVVPVRSGGELIAFVCLGAKRSGDVYTTTDLTMLSAVADKVSSELRRFDQAEVIRQGRAMQESLRRYVPGAVAEELDSGHELDAGEREISVLFVDIRNYTGYSERRSPQEVFAAVNRYTEAVSQIVRQCGGSVVEFSGDGVMAVFGAPRELPEKERAAVRAAQQIVESIANLSLGGRDAFAVGAGIATGRAYVGNVRSADRFIWTALGNTTNLASRLQALTRDLGAAIIVDELTHERAGDLARSFAHRQHVAVRGQSAPVDVYLMPLAAAA